MDMLTRRTLLTASLTGAALLGFGGPPRAAYAQTAEQAVAFIEQTGKSLTGVINGSAAPAEKTAQLEQIVDRDVDINSVARFCIGRFWRSATPEQQQQYLQLFRQMLIKSITVKLGDFQGVTFVVGRATPGDGVVTVASVVTRPGTAPANVGWVVSSAGGSPRIVDLIAEGTSLRLTQRSDYASYLSNNGNNVQALLDAMRQKLTQPS